MNTCLHSDLLILSAFIEVSDETSLGHNQTPYGIGSHIGIQQTFDKVMITTMSIVIQNGLQNTAVIFIEFENIFYICTIDLNILSAN